MKKWFSEHKGCLLIFMAYAIVYFSLAATYMWRNDCTETKTIFKTIAFFPLFCLAVSYIVGIIYVIYDEASKILAVFLSVIALLFASSTLYDMFCDKKQTPIQHKNTMSLYSGNNKTNNNTDKSLNFNQEFTHEDSMTIVYICNSSSAYAYHYNEYCSALNRCSYSIKELTRAEAKKRGRTPCGRCY